MQGDSGQITSAVHAGSLSRSEVVRLQHLCDIVLSFQALADDDSIVRLAPDPGRRAPAQLRSSHAARNPGRPVAAQVSRDWQLMWLLLLQLRLPDDCGEAPRHQSRGLPAPTLFTAAGAAAQAPPGHRPGGGGP